MAIDTFTLNDGTKIPWLAYGNGTGDADKFFTKVGPVAIKAFEHIDTAQGYQGEKAEKATGDLLTSAKVPRSEMYLTTKLSNHNGWKDPVKLEDIRSEIIKSIGFLGRKPNLFLIHSPFVPGDGKGDPAQLKAAWKIFEQLKDEGILESIGVSNFRPQDLEAILEDCQYKPACNQLEFHPYLLAHLDPLLKLQAEHNIRTEAYGPLTPILRYKEGPLTPILEKIAEKHSKATGKEVSPVDVLLLWTKAQGVVAVTASGNPDRIKSLAAVGTFPDLEKEDVEEITNEGKKSHYRYYDEHMGVDFPVPDLPTKAGRNA